MVTAKKKEKITFTPVEHLPFTGEISFISPNKEYGFIRTKTQGDIWFNYRRMGKWVSGRSREPYVITHEENNFFVGQEVTGMYEIAARGPRVVYAGSVDSLEEARIKIAGRKTYRLVKRTGSFPRTKLNTSPAAYAYEQVGTGQVSTRDLIIAYERYQDLVADPEKVKSGTIVFFQVLDDLGNWKVCGDPFKEL